MILYQEEKISTLVLTLKLDKKKKIKIIKYKEITLY